MVSQAYSVYRRSKYLASSGSRAGQDILLHPFLGNTRRNHRAAAFSQQILGDNRPVLHADLVLLPLYRIPIGSVGDVSLPGVFIRQGEGRADNVIIAAESIAFPRPERVGPADAGSILHRYHTTVGNNQAYPILLIHHLLHIQPIRDILTLWLL